jgi:hypothetical protein
LSPLRPDPEYTLRDASKGAASSRRARPLPFQHHARPRDLPAAAAGDAGRPSRCIDVVVRRIDGADDESRCTGCYNGFSVQGAEPFSLGLGPKQETAGDTDNPAQTVRDGALPCDRSDSGNLRYIITTRRMTSAQIKQIAKSIEAFGFTNPILVSDELEILAGKGERRRLS